MRPSNNLENKPPSDTYWRVQLVCRKVQAHSSLESLLKYNQDQTLLMNQGLYDLFNHLVSYRNMLSQTSCRRKTGKEILKSSRQEFLKKFLANNFTLSDTEGNTTRLLNRGGIADLTFYNLPNIQRAKFLGSDGLFCFISICKFGNFQNTFATIISLSELYLRFRTFILLVRSKKVVSITTASKEHSESLFIRAPSRGGDL